MKSFSLKKHAPRGALALAMGCAVSSHAVDLTVYDAYSKIDSGLPVLEEGVSVPYSASPTQNYTYQVSGVGDHFVGFYIDMEIDEALNTYFNEYGSPLNSPIVGSQSWEIDEPDFVFGDIYNHFTNSDESGSNLDNSNGVPSGAEDDVATALGWNFTLPSAFDVATVNFYVGEDVNEIPGSTFYLAHTDPDSSFTVYFWSTLTVDTTPPPPGVPDAGSTLVLMLAGFGSLAMMNLRKPRS